ncbi:MAG: PilZ domain-containing protein [Lachnospiraceae bacterium]|nr:PilZ domain-containing protein [Lachnospiraceae bacterium]
MEERRKSKRTKLASRLIVRRLDAAEDKEVLIDVVDVSKDGVGFTAERPLHIGAVYEAFLTIWTHEVIHAFLQIVRIELLEEADADSAKYSYGARFVGMPEMEANRIEVYQTVAENLNEDSEEVDE